VNTGYKRLQKPLNRALYLLELHSLALEEGQIHVDPEFLMEVRVGTSSRFFSRSVLEYSELDMTLWASQFLIFLFPVFFPVPYWSTVN
jgi:hypothetical protein